VNIKHKLNERLEVYKSLHFPYSLRKRVGSYRYQSIIGIGGNIGDVKRRFNRLFILLQKDKRVSLVKTSLILKNPPFGYANQDDFFNSIMVIETSMQAKEFLRYLLALEKKFARKRSFANAPRTLDLDILFFNNQVINTAKLTVPHPSWSQRESVLIPLASLQS